ncbi:MAG: phosphatase PAP2 family protein, partial [Halobacteriaceae archaeon]
GFAVIVLTKFLFELPRPPDTLRQISKTSYGFPSGHVTGATAFYGGLAIYSRWLNKHRRWILSIFAVTIIAFSRLVLGVHYFVDLLGGVVFGGISLILVHFLTNYDLRLGFLFAFTVALLSGYFAGLAQDSLLAIGGTFGVLLGQIISDFLGFQWASPSPVLAVAGFGICSSFLGGAYFLSNPTIVLLFSMIAGLGAVSIPYIESQIPSYSGPIH